MANKSLRFLSLLVLFLGLSGFSDATKYKKLVGMYELRKGDFSVKVTNWGATIISVVVPDKKG
jgi:aldose 1-epimerase